MFPRFVRLFQFIDVSLFFSLHSACVRVPRADEQCADAAGGRRPGRVQVRRGYPVPSVGEVTMFLQ